MGDDDIIIQKDKIMKNLEKYGIDARLGKGLNYIIDSCSFDNDLISYNNLERKFLSLKPPYQFVVDNESKVSDQSYTDNFSPDIPTD